MLAFADAILSRQKIEERRSTLLELIGEEATAEAAAVVGGFEAVNRVADAAGTKLDSMTEAILGTHLAGLGIESMRQDDAE